MLNNQKGFTLIELIIVVSIVAMLSVVAITAVHNKRSQARDAKRYADANAIYTALAIASTESSQANQLLYDNATCPMSLPHLYEANNPVDRNGKVLLDFSKLKDPLDYSNTCVDFNVSDVIDNYCIEDGDYTILEIENDCYFGTFSHYKIGISLENDKYLYVSNASLQLVDKPVINNVGSGGGLGDLKDLNGFGNQTESVHQTH